MREQEGVRGTVHCWESTQLHRAWEKGVQQEAARMADVLFGRDALPVLQGRLVIEVDTSGTVDVQAAFAGMLFTEVEEQERDWVEWVDWDQLAGGAGPSS